MEVHWIVLLIAIVPFWLLQNVIHELSHGLALRWGWKWDIKIWPFPSKRLGRFTFAHVTYKETSESTDPGNCGWAMVSIMPHIVNMVFIFLCGILLAIFSNKIVSILLLTFMWTNLIDFCNGLFGSLRKQEQLDVRRVQKYLGISDAYLKSFCIGLMIYQIVYVVLITIFSLI